MLVELCNLLIQLSWRRGVFLFYFSSLCLWNWNCGLSRICAFLNTLTNLNLSLIHYKLSSCPGKENLLFSAPKNNDKRTFNHTGTKSLSSNSTLMSYPRFDITLSYENYNIFLYVNFWKVHNSDFRGIITILNKFPDSYSSTKMKVTCEELQVYNYKLKITLSAAHIIFQSTSIIIIYPLKYTLSLQKSVSTIRRHLSHPK